MSKLKKVIQVGLPCLALFLFASKTARPSCDASTCNGRGTFIDCEQNCDSSCGNCSYGYFCGICFFFNGDTECYIESCGEYAGPNRP